MRRFSYLIGLMLITTSTPVFTQDLLFTLSGTDNASFLFDPGSSFLQSTYNGYTSDSYFNLGGSLNGAATTFTLGVFDAAGGGGFELRSPLLTSDIVPDGTVIFQGTLDAPIFATGTFTFNHDFLRGSINDKLVISDGTPPPAVPEPGSWMMMLAGFAAIAVWIRRGSGIFQVRKAS